MKARPFLFAIAILLTSAPVLSGADVGALIRQGDEFDKKFQPAEALKFYLPAEELAPRDAALLVRIARQYVYRMTDLPDRAQKLESARTALDYAERAVAADPRDADAHLSVAICLGRLTQLQGNREKVEASRRIKESAERALELNPRDDFAWHLLGRWHQALAGMGGLTRGIAGVVYGSLPDASNERAVECFEKAIQLRPDRLIHHIELGRTYAQMGRKQEARASIEKGLAMPDRDKDDPETKGRGRATLRKL
jgi:tetratricopeptide (TPR) repeat protein